MLLFSFKCVALDFSVFMFMRPVLKCFYLFRAIKVSTVHYSTVLEIPAFLSAAADSKCFGPIQLAKMCLESALLRRFILPVRYPLPFNLHHIYQHIHPGMSRGNRDESPQGLIISLRNATCLPQLEGAVACVLRWVGGGREQGSVRVFGAGDLDQEGSTSLTLTCDIDRPSDL